MDILKINGTKVRLTDIRYGSNDAQTLTWAVASVMVYEPACGWIPMDKVHATVKLQENDTYDFKTGCALALNILKRKALDRFTRDIEKNRKEALKYLEARRVIAEAASAERHDLDLKFKELA